MPDSVQDTGDAVNKAGNDSALGSSANRMDLDSVKQSEVHSVSSVAQACLTTGDPMNRSIPGFLVHQQLQDFYKYT